MEFVIVMEGFYNCVVDGLWWALGGFVIIILLLYDAR